MSEMAQPLSPSEDSSLAVPGAAGVGAGVGGGGDGGRRGRRRDDFLAGGELAVLRGAEVHAQVTHVLVPLFGAEGPQAVSDIVETVLDVLDDQGREPPPV